MTFPRVPRLVPFLSLLGVFAPWAQAQTAEVDPGEPVLEGEGLEVVGTVEVNQQVQVLTKDQITAAQAQDVADLLENALNLSVARNGGYGNQSGVRLRGFGSGRVAILVDGVPVNSAQSGTFDLGLVSLSSLERIEVVSGGSDTKYNVNGAIGGVINLVTARPATPGFRFGAEVSNLAYVPGTGEFSAFDTQAASVRVGAGGEDLFWSVDLDTHKASNRYSYVDEDGKSRLWTGNGVWDVGAAATFGTRLPGDMRLQVSSNATYGDKAIPGPINSGSPGTERDLSTRTSAVLGAASVGTESLGTTLTLSHRLLRIDWTDAATHSVHNLNTLGLIDRWDWAATEGLSVQSGGDLDYSILDSNTVGTVQDYNGGVYATVQWTLADRFDLVPSVKGVFAKDLTGLLPVPKLGLVYRIDDQFTLKNNYFRTFKLPSMNDRYWPADATAVGNPNLKPEDGAGTDLVLDGTFPNLFSFETSVYATHHQDAILWQTAAGKWRPINVGRAFYAGSEASVKSLVAGPLTLTARYAFLMTWVLTDGLTFADNKRMPYEPVHALTLGADTRWDTGTASLVGHFESERYVSTLNITLLKPFFTLDLNLDQEIGHDLVAFLAVKNLLNQTYFSVDGYPMPAASVTAGLRFQLGGK